jgi:hypothetical protein
MEWCKGMGMGRDRSGRVWDLTKFMLVMHCVYGVGGTIIGVYTERITDSAI